MLARLEEIDHSIDAFFGETDKILNFAKPGKNFTAQFITSLRPYNILNYVSKVPLIW